MFSPHLDDCRLDDRLSLVISNLGGIELTKGGSLLLLPFLGARVSPVSLFGRSGPLVGAGVNGTPINMPFLGVESQS
jgi:hypothetical protein